jgi:hypothetical protein
MPAGQFMHVAVGALIDVGAKGHERDFYTNDRGGAAETFSK